MDPRTQETANSTGKRRHDDSRDNNDGEGEVCALAKRPKTPFTRQSSIQSWYPESSSSTGLTASSYTVAWICAIHCELAAAMAMLDETHPHLRDQPEHDSNHYILGSISGHNVAVACLPTSQYGTVNATNVVTNLKRTFPSIRTCLMVGVGGGVPGLSHDIRLGDVVVGIRVMPYELGKVGAGGQIQHTNTCLTLDHSISTLLSIIRAKHELAPSRVPSIIQERFSSKPEYRHPELPDRLFQATYDHILSDAPGQCDTCHESKVLRRCLRASTDPEIHYGAIASGDKLMKDGLTRDELARRLDVICFEMEAAGLMGVMSCLPIRGICDYSDSHKNKNWQKYAAAAAAAYARELLETMPAASVEAPRIADNQSLGEAKSDKPSLHERRAQILSSLAFAQLDSRRQTIKRAQARTCQWFLRTPEYEHWQDRVHQHDHHGFMWIRGKPGVGKSTMMKFLFDNARKSEKKTSSFTISFFFNARGDTLEKSVSGMYRSLLLQLLEHFTDLQDLLDDPSIAPRNPDECLPLEILKDIFETAISRLGDRTLTCFVDALDEGDEQQIIEMVHFFEEIAEASSQGGIPFKICFSSRYYPYINIKYGQSLSLEEQEGHNDDLRNYVQAKLGVQDAEMLNDLEIQLVEKSQGVFLWLTLVVDILRQEINCGGLAMKKRLAEIPQGLSDLFRDILARDTKNMDNLLLGISWILFAKRPLGLLEYYHAIWAGLAKSGIVDSDLPNVAAIGAEELAERCVLSSTKGLAEVMSAQAKRSVRAKMPNKPTVQFIHESVRDYLLKDGGMNELWPDLSLNMEAKCHEQLKECCLFYLKHQAVASLISGPGHDLNDIGFDEALSLGPTVPLLEYASQHVLCHADAAAAIFPQHETLRIFSPLNWSKLFNMYERYKIRRYDKSTSLTYMFADNGLANLIRTYAHTERPHRMEKSTRYRYPLFAALAKESESAVAALLGMTSPRTRFCDYGTNLNLKGHEARYKHHSPLSWAAEVGQKDVIQALIKQGVDIDGKSDSPTPLDFALDNLHLDAARILLENSARKAKYDHLEKGTVEAARLGDESLVRLLIGIGAPTYKAFLTAFSRGRERVVEATVAACPIFDDQVPVEEDVIKGCRDNYMAMAKYLIQNETDPAARSKIGKVLLFLAAMVGPELESVLQLPSGVDVNCQNSKNDTPFAVALRLHQWPIARFLIDNGARIDIKLTLNRQTPLHTASQYSAGESLIKLLLARGADVAARDSDQRTPLYYASSCKNNKAVVSLLLEHGSEVDAKDVRGETPLFIASRWACCEVVTVLFQHGTDVNVVNDDGYTPLAYASERKDPSLVSELIRHGCSVDSLPRSTAPLHRASEFGSTEIVRLLLLAGANANAKDTIMRVPLHLAACGLSRSGPPSRHEAVAKVLLEIGQCDVDAQDHFGETPLHNACSSTKGEGVVKLLIENGANPNISNKRGRTPLDYAKKFGNEHIVHLLIEHDTNAAES